ncbi:MAG: hypothetical protein DWQ06_12340 [Calditrichaeota bacterium]|nr:MAG: hypothetical protein DWQ06_12340 [Calditrichota bacterium]
MARVKPEEIIEDLSSFFKRAMQEAVKDTFPNQEIDSDALFRNFKRQVRRRSGSWQNVSDRAVQSDY